MPRCHKFQVLDPCGYPPGGYLSKETISDKLAVPLAGYMQLTIVVVPDGKSLWDAGELYNYTGPLPDKLEPHHRVRKLS
jgi:hypothetical protein